MHDDGGNAFRKVEAVLGARPGSEQARGSAEAEAARDALREAAVAVMHAQGSVGERDPGEAVAAWRALVAGRWSLVEHFDSDGKRFFIARRHDPVPRVQSAHRPLTRRERQVVAHACLGHSNKLIGYELGLAPATVATHLARAADKLGTTSRAELIRQATLLAGEPAPAVDGGATP
ncbi:MAG: response regulator transcription factor [Polyangiaceae bacterium]|nr:response regulator transcription factor [Polyangiaceae bacterium]